MTIETDLYALLSNDAGVAALVGDAIYPDVVPQEIELPVIAFSRIDTEYTNTIHASAPVAAAATFEMWCMAETRLAADAIATAVIAAVNGAGHLVESRRSELDAETGTWASVLDVVCWE